jgi:hypothetical protein
LPDPIAAKTYWLPRNLSIWARAIDKRVATEFHAHCICLRNVATACQRFEADSHLPHAAAAEADSDGK